MTKVSLQRCDDYTDASLRPKIEQGLLDIGFNLAQFNNKKVALKPNIISPLPPEKAVITHPEFFRAVAQIVHSHGGKCVIIESPAVKSLEKAIKKTPYLQIIKEEGIEIADDKESAILHNDDGLMFKRFEILKAFFDVDIIINLPKLKTHDLTHLTGCVKNMFGVVPGLNKAKWHTKANNAKVFPEFLLDLYGALTNANNFERPRPVLHIMDAILGMEGDGPGARGIPKHIGAILIGDDGIAVDFIEAQIVGVDINNVLTTKRGAERKLGAASFDEIEILGESLEDMKIEGFLPPNTKVSIFLSLEQRFIFSTFFKNSFVEKPVAQEDRCMLCHQCKTICASEAISNSNKKRKTPEFDYKKCIRCYCCMEICPEAAIELKKGKLQWLMR